MKWVFNFCILLSLFILPVEKIVSQQLARFNTAEILNRAKLNPLDFNNFPYISRALPLIDTSVAVELAKLSGLPVSNPFVNAVTLLCKDSSFRQMLLAGILVHDSLCYHGTIEKNEYDKGASATYEYWPLTNNVLAQTGRNDTIFLKTAIREFEFWAPFAKGFMDTVMKSGMHQLTIGKRRFDPCLLAAYGNCRLWACCIYLVTGNEEYGSANDELNEVYRKLLNGGRGKHLVEKRKEFVHFRKKETATLPVPVTGLDSLDFETVPAIKEKFDDARKKENWQITIFTHENKGLFFIYNTTQVTGEFFTKRTASISSLYFAELTTPSTIEITKIDYGDRF